MTAGSRSTFPFELVRTFAGSLLTEYARSCAYAASDARRFVRRALRLGGARLLQSAFEQERFDARFTSTNLAIVQTAARLLDDPGGAAKELYTR